MERVARRTPVLSSRTISERAGGVVALKAENLQRTGSFKVRGASAKLATLGEVNGVVAAAAGASLGDAVRCGVYVTDMATFKDVNEAYSGYFGDAPPARSTIGVASLPLGADVEIDAILAVPD